MNTLKTKRGHVKGCLTRAVSFAESIDDRVSFELLEIRLQKLEEAWTEFGLLQNQLLEFADDADFTDPEPEFEEYEAKYFVAQSTLTKVIRDRRKNEKPSASQSVVDKLADQQASFLENLSASQSSSISLPKIEIPPFSGDYREWTSFRDLFLGSIDTKSNLSTTQKFRYLKSYLRGEAANLIRHISVSDANYLDAWERLEKRYDRGNLIIQSHIQSFLSLPSMGVSSVTTLRKITDSADETVRGLNALGSTSRDPWLIYLLLQKLDPDTRQVWAEEIGARDDCTVAELISFLQLRCDALESCQSLVRLNPSRGKNPKVIQSHFTESNTNCPKCKSDHTLSKCALFISLDVNTRREFAKQHSLCFNCLRPGHVSTKCRSNFRYRTCNSRHHTLVHPQTSLANSGNIETPVSSSNNTASSSSNPLIATQSPLSLCSSVAAKGNSFVSSRITTILPTALVHVHDKQRNTQNIRLLLDSGSQVSFVTESTVQRLGLPRKQARIPVLGIGSTSAGVTNGVVTLKLYSRFTQDFVEVQCYVVSKLTSSVPVSLLNVSDDNTFDSFELADPKFNVPGRVDVLIGADKTFSIFNGTAIRGKQGTPDLIPTIFGWVVCGTMKTVVPTNCNSVDSFCTQLDTANSFDLERFWRLEEVQHKPRLSADDQRAEDIFAKSHSRLPDGRYMVQLPFKSDNKLDFGNSLNIALNRFKFTERRIESNHHLREEYVRFMDEYLNLGHMEEVPTSEIYMPSSECYYLPHHPVFKNDSSTTKVRVVFDGSAKTLANQSLNDSLLIGQTYQRDLFSICIRFRRHLYTIAGDIEKMFRQIRVTESHTNFQRILWRKSNDIPLKHYRLLTVTYGTACAPFLAVRTLYQLALDSMNTYPRAAEVLLNDFYIDDVMTGADSIEEVTSLRTELISLLKSGGFNLRKWTTNCWPLLLTLPMDQRELSPIQFEESTTVKLLGMQWCPSKDSFSFKVHLASTIVCTKRRILSESSRIFDPLGFLAPVIVGVKVLFQDLWRQRLQWDDEIPEDLAERWRIIRQELYMLESISIPRILWTNKRNFELHAFCDASLDAYAAAVYCRSETTDGLVNVSLVAAKTRVAPIRVQSLPRLELCGATLLVRLINKLKISLQDKDIKVFAWTDSSIVLHWLSAPPKKWSVFIANRTSEILTSISRQSWNHVSSASNPADIATRGIPPSLLQSNEMWWKGPLWLWKERNQWPVSNPYVKDVPVQELEERRSSKIQVLLTNIKLDTIFEDILVNSSNWWKSVRVAAYVLRFISNIRCKSDRQYKSLSTEEIVKAKTRLIKCAQKSMFLSVISALEKQVALCKRHTRLKSLSPFLDSNGVLRVGGRLHESDLSYNTKHPIILHKSHPISRLIAEYLHKKYLHAGVSHLFALLKQEFYILGCRNLLRNLVHKCVICLRQRQRILTQQMGNLPIERIRFSRPFSKVGCDYAGPLTLRLSRGRNPKFVKAYIALFVCFVTKGIHLELVGDLSTKAFLLALDRFAARRGKPIEIWSDNATNFHGAKKMLDEMHACLLSQQHQAMVADHLSCDNIAWKFIPPSAPHFGGLWEAGVKSVKTHLKRVIGDNILTYEELYTLIVKIEALLNSRPMWPTSDSEPTALTPSHFLIGEPYTAVPQPDITHTISSPISNWHILQILMQGFWKRWHQEYLTSLQQRPKWQGNQPDINVGDVVLLKEPNLPPSKWILGRVVKTHPGKDNKIRVVTVKTQFKEYIRPIVKIVPLYVSERPESFRGG